MLVFRGGHSPSPVILWAGVGFHIPLCSNVPAPFSGPRGGRIAVQTVARKTLLMNGITRGLQKLRCVGGVLYRYLWGCGGGGGTHRSHEAEASIVVSCQHFPSATLAVGGQQMTAIG